MVSILIVCLGNICRSPAAEAILRHKAAILAAEEQIAIASCGIGDWHVGQLPDARMRRIATERGFVLASRAQQFREEFLDLFDYILAVDHDVMNDLYRHAKTAHHKAKIHLIMEFSASYDAEEVPDPYYGSAADFELVLDMLEDACEGLLKRITPA